MKLALALAMADWRRLCAKPSLVEWPLELA
jgi:hypothetical protein